MLDVDHPRISVKSRSERTTATYSPSRVAESLISLLTVGARPESHSNRVIVLCYHSVHPSNSRATVTPDGFDAHLQWLRDYCHLIPFSEVLDTARRNTRGKPSVAITFDDGYADNHKYALPLLTRYRIPATFFLTTGFIDGNARVFQQLAQLQNVPARELTALSWTQVLEIRDAGMELGSHGCSHFSLRQHDGRFVTRELLDSKKALEDHLGQPVVSFAYPFGKPKHHFSKGTVELVAKSGYTRAAAIHMRAVQPRDSAYAIPRFPIWGDRIDHVIAMVFGRLDILGHWQEYAPRWVSRHTSRQNRLTG
jgi:peptidoglycan/xylan/chitin deacetylase (PgdA/CDA1 family)